MNLNTGGSPRGAIRDRIQRSKEAIEPFKDLVSKLLKSLDPDSYDSFTRSRPGEFISYLALVTTVATVLLGVVSLPVFLSLPDHINEGLNHFDELILDPQFSTVEPMTLTIGGASVRIDTKASADVSGMEETVVVDSEAVHIKMKRCWILDGAFCLLKEPQERYTQRNISEYANVLEQREKVVGLLSGAILYALPLIGLVIIALLIVKYLLIATIITVITSLSLRPLGMKIKTGALLRMAVYAMTLPIIIATINLGFGLRLFFAHWLIFLAYFGLAIYLQGGEKSVVPIHHK